MLSDVSVEAKASCSLIWFDRGVTVSEGAHVDLESIPVLCFNIRKCHAPSLTAARSFSTKTSLNSFQLQSSSELLVRLLAGVKKEDGLQEVSIGKKTFCTVPSCVWKTHFVGYSNPTFSPGQ